MKTEKVYLDHIPAAGAEPENIYKVPRNKWRSWSPAAREMFNRMAYLVGNNRSMMVHPKMPELVDLEHWRTIAWNAAWLAADEVDRMGLDND